MSQFKRISHNINTMGGKACITGTRITVGMILIQISEGMSINDLLAQYPKLSEADITEALRYAAWLAGIKEDTLVSA